jgi:hypothetical protein
MPNFNPTATVSPLRDADLAARGLPPVAYVENTWNRSPDAPRIVAVKRGETGYYPIETKCTAAELNDAIGITHAQAQAMYAGSMFGWDVKGADPATYAGRLDIAI